MNRAFTNILCANLEKTAQFYETLLGMTRHYSSDWFVILTHPNFDGLEFGLLDRAHQIVPPEASKGGPAGVILTFVVDDVAPYLTSAKALGATVVEEPRSMPYGQTRLLLRDPEGTLIDISAPTP